MMLQKYDEGSEGSAWRYFKIQQYNNNPGTSFRFLGDRPEIDFEDFQIC